MLKFIVLILLFNFSLFSTTIYEISIDECLHAKAFEIIEGEVGVVEKTGKNDGEVEKYLKVVGLPKGYPYCAAGISWSYLEASKFYGKDKSFIPFPMTAGSQVVLNHAISIGKKVSRNLTKGDFFVWRRKDSYQGHIGVIESLGEKGWVNTIEFNTSGNSTGDQRDGGGVWKKKRNTLQPLGMLLIRGFVGFKNLASDLCSPKEEEKVIEISKTSIVERNIIKETFEMYKSSNFLKNFYTQIILAETRSEKKI